MFHSTTQTLFIGRNLQYLPQCSSTNSLLLEQCRVNTVPPGTVLITSHQTAGRGRQGNSWHAKKGLNLTFSIALHPLLALEKQFNLSLLTSLAIVDYLKIREVTAKIKWPNDILIDRRKCGGILIENMVEGMRIKTSVVGIGLNINEPMAAPAVSVGQAVGKYLVLQEELEKLLLCFEKRFLQMEAESELKAAYQSCLFGMNEKRKFQLAGKTIFAEVCGVEESGKLLLKMNEKVFSVGLNEVKWEI